MGWQGEVDGFLLGVQQLEDRESGSLEVSLPAGKNELGFEMGISTSAMGTGTYASYFRPDWEVRHTLDRGRRKLRPYAAYKGYVFFTGDTTQFKIDDTSLNSPVQPGSSTEFSITFSPTAPEGKKSATVSISNNDPDSYESPYTFKVKGEAVLPGV